MKFYRQIVSCFVLLLVVFILCFAQTAMAAESPTTGTTGTPSEIKSTTAPPPAPPSAPPPVVSTPGKLNRNAIGCILPLTGKYADWGNKALDAIKLSARHSGKTNNTPWEVIAEDSQSLPEKAKAAVANLAGAKNVMAIIAITETAEAVEVAAEANRWHVPIMMITAKEGVTSAGEFVFQHFLTPSQQAKALVKLAINDLNAAIFAVLYPQDEYGEEMFKAFRKEVMSAGGRIEKAISYSKSQTDFAGEISKLAGVVVKSPSKKIKKEEGEEEEIIPVNFEALFIPDSYARIKMITSQLDFYNVKGFVLLGTSLWNSPNLLKSDPGYLEGAIFADSFFAEGLYPETYNFVDLYQATYKRSPENIEALAFDTAGMIFAILENANIKTRSDLATGLKKIGMYDGATGGIYFDADRVAQKTPFILRIREGQIEQMK